MHNGNVIITSAKLLIRLLLAPYILMHVANAILFKKFALEIKKNLKDAMKVQWKLVKLYTFMYGFDRFFYLQ